MENQDGKVDSYTMIACTFLICWLVILITPTKEDKLYEAYLKGEPVAVQLYEKKLEQQKIEAEQEKIDEMRRQKEFKASKEKFDKENPFLSKLLSIAPFILAIPISLSMLMFALRANKF